jgi:hypothetical protein
MLTFLNSAACSNSQQDLIQDHSTGSELEATQPIEANEFADNEDNDGDIVTGPTVEAHVHLAKTASMCFNCYIN